ncbi:MAG TPA: hypothetical protein VM368_06990, partial [Flavisolibacter sp.]|nr:hypothetical protein [Flavisolibacter sp.]
MRFLKYSILTALLFSFSSLLFAQQKNIISRISGTVTGKNNKGLAGVRVEVQEENRRTFTGSD